MHRTIVALFAVALATFSACDSGGEPNPTPDTRETAAPAGLRLNVSLDGVPEAQVPEIAKYLESLAAIESVRVELRKTDEGPAQAAFELWGTDLPSADGLIATVRDNFAGLAQTSMTADVLDASAREPALPKTLYQGTPQEVRANVERELRARGVEGEIDVQIRDEDGEKRVEIRVEDEAHHPK